jgi:hypothetical protein
LAYANYIKDWHHAKRADILPIGSLVISLLDLSDTDGEGISLKAWSAVFAAEMFDNLLLMAIPATMHLWSGTSALFAFAPKPNPRALQLLYLAGVEIIPVEILPER